MAVNRHPNGSWRARIDLPSDGSSKRRRVSLGYFDTRKDAEKAVRKALEARDRGDRFEPELMTVEQLLERYVAARVAQGKVGLRTAEEYPAMAERYLNSRIGHILAANLRPAHISKLIVDLRDRGGEDGKGLSARTVKHAFSLLKSALAWGVRQEIILRNVADSVDAPVVSHREAQAFAADELVRLFEATREHRFAYLYQFAAATSCRRGEIAALRWADIDWERRIATVRQSVVVLRVGKRRMERKKPKNERVRTVSLSELAIGALAAQKKRLGKAYDPAGTVFPALHGGQLSPDSITSAFYEHASALGLRTTSFHALRHTAATMMVSAGVDITTAASVLGNNPVVMLRVYSHLIDGAQRKAVDTIAEGIEAAQGTRDGTIIPKE